MTQNYEQATVEIVPHRLCKYEVFYSSIIIQNFNGKRFDLLEELLKNGLAEINQKSLYIMPPNYMSLQSSAEKAELSVWGIKAKYNYKLKPGVIEKVKLVSFYNPIKFAVQILNKDMDHITDYFNQKGQDLKPIDFSDKISEQLCTNDCIVAKIENKYYRARIDSFATQQQKNGKSKIVGFNDIVLIDFCEGKNDVNNDTEIQFFYLPDELKASIVGCCNDSVIELSSKGRVFESLVTCCERLVLIIRY